MGVYPTCQTTFLISCNFHLDSWPSAKLMLIAPGIGLPVTALTGFKGWRAILQRPNAVLTVPLERSVYGLSVIFGHVSGQIASKNVGVSVGREIDTSFWKHLGESATDTHCAMSEGGFSQ